MPWDDELFAALDDLAQQADGLWAGERDLELPDRMRAEYRHVELVERLMASVDRELALGLLGVGTVSGVLERVGADWCLVRGHGQDWVIRLDALTTVAGASPRAVPAVAWSPVARLGLGSALRRLAEEQERCQLHLLDGTRHVGVLARVGADFTEVESARMLLIPHRALAAVQSRPDDPA